MLVLLPRPVRRARIRRDGRWLSPVALGGGVRVRLVPHAALCLLTSPASVSIVSRLRTLQPPVAGGPVASAAGPKVTSPTCVLWWPVAGPVAGARPLAPSRCVFRCGVGSAKPVMVLTLLLCAFRCGEGLAKAMLLLAPTPRKGLLRWVWLVALVRWPVACLAMLPALRRRPCNGLLRQVWSVALAGRGATFGVGLFWAAKLLARRARNGLLRRVWLVALAREVLYGDGLIWAAMLLVLRPRNGLLRRVRLVVVVHQETNQRYRLKARELRRGGLAGVDVRVSVGGLSMEFLTLFWRLIRCRALPPPLRHLVQRCPCHASSTGVSRLLVLKRTSLEQLLCL